MAQVLAATSTFSFFRDRDLFIHDGTKLRRFRLSAPVQAFFFVLMIVLVSWSGFAATRMVVSGPQALSLSDATEARARKIEQRQALIEAILTGQNVDERRCSRGGRRPCHHCRPARSRRKCPARTGGADRAGAGRS